MNWGRNVREKAVRQAAITHPRLLSVFVNECMDMLQELEKKKKRREEESIQYESIGTRASRGTPVDKACQSETVGSGQCDL